MSLIISHGASAFTHHSDHDPDALILNILDQEPFLLLQLRKAIGCIGFSVNPFSLCFK